MPIGFPSDGSPQGGGTFTSGSTFYATVNQQKLDTTSNNLKTFIDNKQNTLTAATSLLGIGSSITQLNYNNITLNLPSTFPSDWSIVANKPSTFPSDYNTQANKPTYYPCDLSSYYTKPSTDTLLNAKQPLIIATCNLVGNGSAITALNYNNLTNAPNLSGFATISSLSSYQLLLTSTTTLSGIGSNLTLINYNALSNLPNLSGYATTGSLSGYQLLLTSTTTLSGIGSNLTLINYNALSNLPNLSGYATTGSLSGYQLLLTATTTLLGVGSNLTLINYNALSNLPNLAQYLTACTTGLTNYTTTSSLTTILSNYSSTANTTTLISSALVPYSTTTAMNSAISTALTPYLTTAIAGTTYQPKINTYTLSPSGTAIFNSGVLTFDLSAYQTSASLGATYLALAGGTMTGNLTLSTGVLTVSSTTNYSYFGGLRIAGWDGNTLYNGTNQLGITALNNVSIQTGTTLANYATRLLINTSGNIGIGTTNPYTLFHMKGTNPILTITGQGNSGAKSQIDLTYYDPGTYTSTCSLIATDNGNFTSTFQINLKTAGAVANTQFTPFLILGNGNIGIGTNNPSCKLQVYNGVANINNGSPYAVPANFMAAGSLTIGGTTANYGGGSSQWTTNTAGLLMECQDNTEIAIHDAGNRLASFMYYVGGGTNQFYIGRDMGWGAITQTNFSGNLNVGGTITSANNVYINNNCQLIFDNQAVNADNRIQLWTGYGFGIRSSTLVYTSGGNHLFLANGNQTFKIDGSGNLAVSGNVSGGYNLSKKSIISFTPNYYSAGAGSYYYFNIDVSLYISGCPGPYSTMYAFRATLFTNTGDWGDTGNNVETMAYNCFVSGYAGGKSRFYQIFNSSSYSYLFYPGTGTNLYYWGGTVGGGGGGKILILENIAYY